MTFKHQALTPKQMDVTQYTLAMMAINSYLPEGKRKIIQYVETILREKTDAEIIVNTDIEPCLIAKLKATQSKHKPFKLLLEGHLDVVDADESQFTPKQTGSLIYGRGSVDMKSGCACILTAFLDAAQDSDRQADLTLVFTTDEETTGASIKHLLENNILEKHDFALIPEPTNGQICNAHKGQSWINVEFHGLSAHSSLPHLGQNAIYMAADFIQVLRRNTNLYLEDPKFGKETISVGCIEGGTDPNVVPDYAKVRIDKRYLPHQDVTTGLEEIKTAIKTCEQNDPNFRATINLEGDWSALLTDQKTPYFKELVETVDKAMQQQSEIVFWTAWGEGAYISRYDTPTIYFGPGDTKLAHTQDEYVDLNQVYQVMHSYQQIIQRFCK